MEDSKEDAEGAASSPLGDTPGNSDASKTVQSGEADDPSFKSVSELRTMFKERINQEISGASSTPRSPQSGRMSSQGTPPELGMSPTSSAESSGANGPRRTLFLSTSFGGRKHEAAFRPIQASRSANDGDSAVKPGPTHSGNDATPTSAAPGSTASLTCTFSAGGDVEKLRLRLRSVEADLEQANFELAALKARHLEKMARLKQLEEHNLSLDHRNRQLQASLQQAGAVGPRGSPGSQTSDLEKELADAKDKLAEAEKELDAFRALCSVSSVLEFQAAADPAQVQAFRAELQSRVREWQGKAAHSPGSHAGDSMVLKATGSFTDQAGKEGDEPGKEKGHRGSKSPFGGFFAWGKKSGKSSSSEHHNRDGNAGVGTLVPSIGSDPSSELKSSLRDMSWLANGDATEPVQATPSATIQELKDENAMLSAELAALKIELEATRSELKQTTVLTEVLSATMSRRSASVPQSPLRTGTLESSDSELPLSTAPEGFVDLGSVPEEEEIKGGGYSEAEGGTHRAPDEGEEAGAAGFTLARLLETSQSELDEVGDILRKAGQREQGDEEMQRNLKLKQEMDALRAGREKVLAELDVLQSALERIKLEKEQTLKDSQSPAEMAGAGEVGTEKEVLVEEFTLEDADGAETQGKKSDEAAQGEQDKELAKLREQVRWLQARLESEQRIKDGHVASMAEMREEVEAVMEERDSKLAALKASVVEIVRLKEQLAQLREAETLLGQKLGDTLADKKRLQGELEDTRGALAESKGVAAIAQEDLEASRKRAEDLKHSVVQLMDRLEIQQNDIERGKEECDKALRETERVVAELGEKGLLIENLLKTQLEMERELEATRRAHTAAAAETEEVRRQLRFVTEKQGQAEEQLAQERADVAQRRQEFSTVAAVAAKGGEDKVELEDELRKEKEWSASLEERCNGLERQCQGVYAELEQLRTKVAEEREKAADAGRGEAIARRLQDAEKALWQARLEEERAKEEVEGLKSSCTKLDAELSSKTAELAKLRWQLATSKLAPEPSASANIPVIATSSASGGAASSSLNEEPEVSSAAAEVSSAPQTRAVPVGVLGAPPATSALVGAVGAVTVAAPAAASSREDDLRRVEELEREVAELQEALRVAEGTKHDLQRKLEEALNQWEAAEERVQAAEEQLELANAKLQQMDLMEARVRELEGESRGVRETMQRTEDEREQIERQVAQLEALRVAAEGRAQVMQLRAEKAEGHVKTMGALGGVPEEMPQRLLAAEGKVRELDLSKFELEGKLRAMTKECQLAKESLEVLERSHGEAKAALLREKEELEERVRQVEGEFADRTREAEARFLAAEGKVTEMELQVMQSEERIFKAERAAGEKEAKVAGLQADVEDKAKRVSVLEASLVEKQAEVSGMEEELQRTQERVALLEKLLQEMQDKASALDAALVDAESKVEAARAEAEAKMVSARAQAAEELGAAEAQKDEQVRGLQGLIVELQKREAEKEERVRDLQEMCVEAERALAELRREREQEGEEMRLMLEKVEEMRTRDKETASKSREVHAQAEAGTRQIQALEDQLGRLEKEKAELAQEAEVTAAALASAATAAGLSLAGGEAVEHAKALQQAVEEREGRAREAEGRVEELRREQERLEGEVERLNTELEWAKAETAMLNETRASWESEREEIEKEVELLKDREAEGSEKVSELEQELLSLREALTKQEETSNKALMELAGVKEGEESGANRAAALEDMLRKKEEDHEEEIRELEEHFQEMAREAQTQHARELAEAEGRVEEAAAIVDELRGAAEEAQREAEELHRRLIAEGGGQRETDQRLRGRMAELEAELEQMEAQRGDERLALQQQLDVLEEQLAEVARGTQKRLEDLEALEQSWGQEKSQLEKQVRALEAQRVRASEEKASLEGKLRGVEERLMESLAQREQEKEALQKEMEVRLEELEASLVLTHQQEVAELQDHLEKGRGQAKGDRSSSMKAKLEDMEAQLANADAAAEVAIGALRADVEAIAAQKAELETRVEQMAREAQELGREKEDLWERAQEAESEIERLLKGGAVAAVSAEGKGDYSARKLERALKDLDASQAAKIQAESLCRSLRQNEQGLKSKLDQARKEAQRAAEEAKDIRDEQVLLLQTVVELRQKADTARKEVMQARLLALARKWRLKTLEKNGVGLIPIPVNGVGGNIEAQGVKELRARLQEARAAEMSLRERLEEARQKESFLKSKTSDLAEELVMAKEETHSAREAESEAQRQMLVLSRIKDALEGEVRKWREEAKMRRKVEEDSVAALNLLGGRTLSNSSGQSGSSTAPKRALSSTSSDFKVTSQGGGANSGLFLRSSINLDLAASRAKTPERGALGSAKGDRGSLSQFKTPERNTSSREKTPQRSNSRHSGNLQLKKSPTGIFGRSFNQASVAVEEHSLGPNAVQGNKTSLHRVKTSTGSRGGAFDLGPTNSNTSNASANSGGGRGQEFRAATGAMASKSSSKVGGSVGVMSNTEAVRSGTLRKFRSAMFGSRGGL